MTRIFWGAFVLLLTLILGEVTVRLFGHFDVDGNFSIGATRLYPYRLPVQTMKMKIDRYWAAKDFRFIYDPFLGWAPKPGYEKKNGKYCHDENGLRVVPGNVRIKKSPAAGVLRIALFGDSFTYGEDVGSRDTLGDFLERLLKKKGIDAEVLNFGVNGYGMDQAFLRWQKEGRSYAPHIVILGLQLENMNRNCNLVRPLYSSYEAAPMFFKPRFILKGPGLELIDSPAPSLEDVPLILRDFNSWRFSKYERWFEPARYQDGLFLRSKLFAFFYSVFRDRVRPFPDTRREDVEALAFQIVQSFKKDVEKNGAGFCAVYLPLEWHLRLMKAGQQGWPVGFLRKIGNGMPLIRPEAALLEAKEQPNLKKLVPGHYSPLANEIVAGVVADYIASNAAPASFHRPEALKAA